MLSRGGFHTITLSNTRVLWKEGPNLYVSVEVLHDIRRSQWPRGLRRRSTAARPLRLWVRIPPGAWMFVCCECCVLSGRGLCNGLIIRPEESYRLWRVVVCDQENSRIRRLKPAPGLWKIQPQWVVTTGKQTNKLRVLHRAF
jgi:hypothetical protein